MRYVHGVIMATASPGNGEGSVGEETLGGGLNAGKQGGGQESSDNIGVGVDEK